MSVVMNKVAGIVCWFSVVAMLIVAPSLLAEDTPVIHNGVVVEVKNAGSYTYLQIDEAGDKFWIAAPHTMVRKGTQVSFSEQVWMYDFKSKMLGRTFEKILFVADVNVLSNAPTEADSPSTSTTVNPSDQTQVNVAQQPAVTTQPQPITEKAGRYTIEELFSRKDELKGKRISVNGEVVKVSENIMATNWIHIQDGTGKEGNDKIIFRSKTESPALGSAVTAEGTLKTDQDFGYGYSYSVIVEDSTFSK